MRRNLLRTALLATAFAAGFANLTTANAAQIDQNVSNLVGENSVSDELNEMIADMEARLMEAMERAAMLRAMCDEATYRLSNVTFVDKEKLFWYNEDMYYQLCMYLEESQMRTLITQEEIYIANAELDELRSGLESPDYNEEELMARCQEVYERIMKATEELLVAQAQLDMLEAELANFLYNGRNLPDENTLYMLKHSGSNYYLTISNGQPSVISSLTPVRFVVSNTNEEAVYVNIVGEDGVAYAVDGKSEWSFAPSDEDNYVTDLTVPGSNLDGDLWQIELYDDVVAGIEGVENMRQDVQDDAYYNLNGQRVNKPAKGVYIHKGKKVLVK